MLEPSIEMVCDVFAESHPICAPETIRAKRTKRGVRHHVDCAKNSIRCRERPHVLYPLGELERVLDRVADNRLGPHCEFSRRDQSSCSLHLCIFATRKRKSLLTDTVVDGSAGGGSDRAARVEGVSAGTVSASLSPA